MLQPGVIPDSEPKIRVGLILPEDRYTSLSVLVPAGPVYQIRFSGRTLPLHGEKDILFRYSSGHTEFNIDTESYRAPSEIFIEPVYEKAEIEPAKGVTVKNMISGRDFHWKKYINAVYPGTLIIKPYEDRLLLINELPIEQYLMCVATSEMSSACPAALIEAQTIAARSWMLANVEQKHTDLTMDVCNDDCCQRYQGSTFLSTQSIEGAKSTYGQVLIYNNKICDARYSKSCGGMMETFDTIWNKENPGYLKSIPDSDKKLEPWSGQLNEEKVLQDWLKSEPQTFCSPHTIAETELPKYLGNVDEAGHYFRWQVSVSQDEIIGNLKHHHHIIANEINNIKVLKRGGSGRAASISIVYVAADGSEQSLRIDSEFSIRQTLQRKFLYSSAFIVNKTKDGSFQFTGAGWGHGVGLCQIGALGMALNTYSSEQIVLHYYPGSSLKRIY